MMGIPYSKEIDALLEQVVPLVQRIQYIVLLHIVLQILTVFLLCLIFLAITALIISVIPELSNEREALVTPPIKSLAQSLIKSQNPQPGQGRG
jgi:hypothetical protein